MVSCRRTIEYIVSLLHTSSGGRLSLALGCHISWCRLTEGYSMHFDTPVGCGKSVRDAGQRLARQRCPVSASPGVSRYRILERRDYALSQGSSAYPMTSHQAGWRVNILSRGVGAISQGQRDFLWYPTRGIGVKPYFHKYGAIPRQLWRGIDSR